MRLRKWCEVVCGSYTVIARVVCGRAGLCAAVNIIEVVEEVWPPSAFRWRIKSRR